MINQYEFILFIYVPVKMFRDLCSLQCANKYVIIKTTFYFYFFYKVAIQKIKAKFVPQNEI